MKKTISKAGFTTVCQRCRAAIKKGDRIIKYKGYQELFDGEGIVKSEYKLEFVCGGCEDYNVLKDVPF